jgi:type IV fimbrial biogenesis protein FimT
MKKHLLGFTLIELMTALLVLAILIAIAIPSYRSVTKSANITSASGEILSVLQFARTEAIRRGKSIRLDATSGSDATNELGSGFTVYFDANSDSALSAGEALRQVSAVPAGVTVDSVNGFTAFVFSPRGELNQADTWRICDDRTGETGRQITLLVSGLIQMSDYVCP